MKKHTAENENLQKSLRIQYKVKNETKNRKNQKFLKIDNEEIKFERYTERKNQTLKKLKLFYPKVRVVCKILGFELAGECFCPGCEFIYI